MSETVTSQAVVSGETELQVHRVSFHWDIKHFDRICAPDSQDFESFNSDVFTVGEEIGKESEWAISVDSEDGYLQIWCHLENINAENETEIRALISLSIMKSDNSEAWHRTCSKSHVFSPGTDDNGWGLSNIIRLQKLWDERSEFLVDNTLRLKITLDLFGRMVYRRKNMLCGTKRKREGENCLCSQLTEREGRSHEDLQRDLRDVLNSQKGSDFTIQCGLKLFPVHKLIIAARSKVFAAMLDHDTLENQTSTVKINDVSEEVMDHMLEYIYTGTTIYPKTTEGIISLVQAADKYQLEKLKNNCFYKLCCRINHENVGKVAILAYLHNAEEDIENEIKVFIQSNWSILEKKESFRESLIAKPDAFFKSKTTDVDMNANDTFESSSDSESSS